MLDSVHIENIGDKNGMYIMLDNDINSILTDVRRVSVSTNNNRFKTSRSIGNNTIILDNAAEVSIFNNKDILRNIRGAEETICVDGVNGDADGLYVSIIGTTDFNTDAYYSQRAVANILSFGECVDKCEHVSYNNHHDTFIVQVDRHGKYHEFKRHDKRSNLYTCRAEEASERGTLIAHTTVTDNKSKYSKREVAQAQKARDYLRRLGVITAGNLIRLLAAGKIKNAEITVQDVVRSIDIWGKDLANLKGKTTAQTLQIEREIESPIKPLIRQDQVLYIDIMFVNRCAYLLGKFMPSEYIAVRKITSTNIKHMAAAINKMLAYMFKSGFHITVILCDGESAVASEELQDHVSVHIDTSGGESVKVIERLIRVVKERVRGIINTLPYELPDNMLDWLIQHVVYYMNFIPSTGSHDVRSSRERITGKQLNATTDLKHAYGDYVQAIDNNTDNTMKERTKGAIALMPVGNREGSWYYLILKTWRAIKRNRAEALPTSEEVIVYINTKAQEENRKKKRQTASNSTDTIRMGLWRGWEYIQGEEDQEQGDTEDIQGDDDLEQFQERVFQANGQDEEFINEVEQEQQQDHEQEDMGRTEDSNEIVEEHGTNIGREEDIEDTEGEAEYEDYIEPDGSGIEDQATEPSEQAPQSENVSSGEDQNTSRYSLRQNRSEPGRWSTSRRKALAYLRRVFGLKMSIRQAVDKLGVEAVRSIVKEMVQLDSMGTFEGIDLNRMTAEDTSRIISSSTFLKDKYTAEGIFEKLKARLVAGGHLQDRTVYSNNTSPTAITASLFMVAAIAATESRSVATVDFPGAFLHSTMPEDEPAVYVRLNKFEAKVLVKINKSYERFVRKNGTMIVKLKRALYGCVQSARLWYKKLSGDLMKLGYKVNPHDPCVFNRTEQDGKQTTLVLHVDDVFISASSESRIDDIIAELTTIYKEGLSVQRGRKLNYLGMTFDFTQIGKCKVNMTGYVNDLLTFCERIEGTARTPAAENLFKIDKQSIVLEEQDREFYHSVAAKLLYLGKRVRPDILTAVSFLVKRVQEPTEEDMKKLQRTVKYIRGTVDLGIVLEADKNLTIMAYIDASYGVHENMRSHTGTVIGIGKGPIFAKSTGQKINTKSSCEAELVGLSDSTGTVIWVRNFLMGQGYQVGPATIFQDNKSAISMISSGKANAERTRHIAIRYFFVKDRIDSKEVRVEYMRTGEMIADILTKPLQGALFERLRKQLLNQ